MQNVQYYNMQMSFLQILRIGAFHMLVMPTVTLITIQGGESTFTSYTVNTTLTVDALTTCNNMMSLTSLCRLTSYCQMI